MLVNKPLVTEFAGRSLGMNSYLVISVLVFISMILPIG